MSVRSLEVATDGYLSKHKKKRLAIAVNGYLSYAEEIEEIIKGGSSNKKDLEKSTTLNTILTTKL
jgi:hypothetical protein